MSTLIHHNDGDIEVVELPDGRRTVRVQLTTPGLFIRHSEWTTSHPIEVIEAIVEHSGAAFLCHELMREEDPRYIQNKFEQAMLSFKDPAYFKNRRILDFGCGCGASTLVLSRMFPDSQIIGAELMQESVDLALLRAAAKNVNVTILTSPDGDHLPEGIGTFDAIVMSAVYEHLLPDERPKVMQTLWAHLKPGGIIFINETPYRYFPVETHTTNIPLLNYLPDKLAHLIAWYGSRKHPCRETWPTLLRMGIRGGTPSQIMRDTGARPQDCQLLKPSLRGGNDEIDLWYNALNPVIPMSLKRLTYRFLKLLRATTGIVMTTTLIMAIQKKPDSSLETVPT